MLVTIFLAFYFERAMAFAALVALVNDIVVTAGVYSLVGFEVTPATVIGLLTILGFSLYDTVVVFDKVRENTRGLLGLTRRTYAEAANLALNQTLMRSINTSLIAVLPLLGLLIVGVVLLGVGMLGDLALVQLVGMIIGAASSVLLATPIVVDLERCATRVSASRRERVGRPPGRGRCRRDRRGRRVATARRPRPERRRRAGGGAAAGTRHGRRGGVRPSRTAPARRPAGSRGRPTGKSARPPGSGAGDRRCEPSFDDADRAGPGRRA